MQVNSSLPCFKLRSNDVIINCWSCELVVQLCSCLLLKQH